jgi:trimethylamine:corrinoid methyltransferase-like protein
MGSYRGAYYESKLSPRIGLEEWEERGRPRYEDLLRDHTRDLIRDPTLLDDHDDLVARGEAFIKAGGFA